MGRRGRTRWPPDAPRSRGPWLAIVVQDGTVQGVYTDGCGPLAVHLLDDDDLRGDDALAEQVASTGVVPTVTLESGLGRALAAYHTTAARQVNLRRATDRGR